MRRSDLQIMTFEACGSSEMLEDGVLGAIDGTVSATGTTTGDSIYVSLSLVYWRQVGNISYASDFRDARNHAFSKRGATVSATSIMCPAIGCRVQACLRHAVRIPGACPASELAGYFQ